MGLSTVVGKIRELLLNRKSQGSKSGSFYLFRRRREITYEANFITCLQNMLDASPTSAKRLVNAFYEIFIRKTSLASESSLDIPNHQNIYHLLHSEILHNPLNEVMKILGTDSIIRFAGFGETHRAKGIQCTLLENTLNSLYNIPDEYKIQRLQKSVRETQQLAARL